MKLYGLTIRGYWSCFKKSQVLLYSKKLFHDKSRAEEFASEWLEEQTKFDHGFYGKFNPVGPVQVVEYELNEG